MIILALDTSSVSCSVAVVKNNKVTTKFCVAPRQHNEKVLPMVQDLLLESEVALSDLDAISFTTGPGSFTGLRINSSITQGLAYGLDISVIPIATLAAVAYQSYRIQQHQYCLTILAAPRGQVFWGLYKVDGLASVTSLIATKLTSIEDIVLPLEYKISVLYAVGITNSQLPQCLQANVSEVAVDIYPHAHDVAVLAKHKFEHGELVDATQALPSYVYDSVVS